MSLMGYMAAGAAAGIGKGVADTAMLQMKANIERNKLKYADDLASGRLKTTIKANKDSASLLASAKVSAARDAYSVAATAAEKLASAKVDAATGIELKPVKVKDEDGNESVKWYSLDSKTGTVKEVGANAGGVPKDITPATGSLDLSHLWSGGGSAKPAPKQSAATTTKPTPSQPLGLMKNADSVLSELKYTQPVAGSSQSDTAKAALDNYLNTRTSRLPESADPQASRLKRTYEKKLATEQRQVKQAQDAAQARDERFNRPTQDHRTL